MKKYIKICLIFLMCVFLIFTSACSESEKNGGTNSKNDNEEVFFGEYIINDAKSINDISKEYDENDLLLFFEGQNGNAGIRFGWEVPELTVSDVDENFDIEIIRSKHYSVLKTSQGGYFYIFWSHVFTADGNRTELEPEVYFTTNLRSSKNANSFDSIIPNISTAKDVKEIDPYFELTFAMSSGVFSYSYLDKESLLEIEYFHNPEIDDYEDLVVKGISVIPRESAAARYSTILEKDLPDSR